MLLADDIESFWLSGPSYTEQDQAAGAAQLERAYSHTSSALSRTASLAGRHTASSEGMSGCSPPRMSPLTSKLDQCCLA